jgi:hypothetical protein
MTDLAPCERCSRETGSNANYRWGHLYPLHFWLCPYCQRHMACDSRIMKAAMTEGELHAAHDHEHGAHKRFGLAARELHRELMLWWARERSAR